MAKKSEQMRIDAEDVMAIRNFKRVYKVEKVVSYQDASQLIPTIELRKGARCRVCCPCSEFETVSFDAFFFNCREFYVSEL